jgi:dCMP deaminase
VDSDKRVVSVGYNGFPQRVRDLPERYENRDLKILGIIHAEMNTVIFAKRCLKGCTVYVFPFPPCCACASVLIQAGIKRCVTFRESPALRERWGKSLSFAEELFREAGVELQIYDS